MLVLRNHFISLTIGFWGLLLPTFQCQAENSVSYATVDLSPTQNCPKMGGVLSLQLTNSTIDGFYADGNGKIEIPVAGREVGGVVYIQTQADPLIMWRIDQPSQEDFFRTVTETKNGASCLTSTGLIWEKDGSLAPFFAERKVEQIRYVMKMQDQGAVRFPVFTNWPSKYDKAMLRANQLIQGGESDIEETYCYNVSGTTPCTDMFISSVEGIRHGMLRVQMVYGYSGGAYPDSVDLSFTLDLESGDVVTLDKLFINFERKRDRIEKVLLAETITQSIGRKKCDSPEGDETRLKSPDPTDFHNCGDCSDVIKFTSDSFHDWVYHLQSSDPFSLTEDGLEVSVSSMPHVIRACSGPFLTRYSVLCHFDLSSDLLKRFCK